MIHGALTALITPLRDDRIDEPALKRLVEQQIAGGIHGLVPCGTTGEAATLSVAEQLQVIEIVTRTVDRRVPVIAGAGSNNTREAIERTRECKKIGVDATLQVTPYYNKPTQEGLVAHFTAIADAVPLPVILYNVPSRTAVDMTAETVAQLAKHPRIQGIKEATGDMARAAQIRELCGDDFSLLSGDDFSLLSFLAVGGHGVISVTSNVIPQVISDLCTAAVKQQWDHACTLHTRQLKLARTLFLQSNPIPVKAAMAMLGYCQPDMRLPLISLRPDSPQGQQLAQVLTQLGLRS